MNTFEEFCAAYNLNAEASDSLLQYRQYREMYRLLIAVVEVVDG